MKMPDPIRVPFMEIARMKRGIKSNMIRVTSPTEQWFFRVKAQFVSENKGVTMMTYSKPEVCVLGNAAVVIQGSKSNGLEPPTTEPNMSAECELDD